MTSQRLAKYIAQIQGCSRRDAEALILRGRVLVNNQPVLTPAFNVTTSDSVCVSGHLLTQLPAPQLFLFHKPPGYLTTHRDPQGRPTLFSLLPRSLGYLVSIGRLDLNSEGLILLTNHRALAHKLESPQLALVRQYRVRVYGRLPSSFDSFKRPFTLDGVRYAPLDFRVEKKTEHNAWLLLSLREGKNREIRKIMTSLNLKIDRLVRVAYGPFKLGDLQPAAYREIPEKQFKAFL